MDISIRPLRPNERGYTYNQSQQISMQTGRIGHMRGDMGAGGERLYSTWFGFRDDLKTDEFMVEMNMIIDALCSDERYGGVLASRRSLEEYCRDHPESAFRGNYTTEYGFRINTEKYAYLLRLNPTQSDYNCYCFCYVREWFDRHIKQAERGIRFITPNYDELFLIPDGGKICITLDNGEQIERVCRYIDDYHVEVGSNLYHICEFAERMEQAGNKVEPLTDIKREKDTPTRVQGEER